MHTSLPDGPPAMTYNLLKLPTATAVEAHGAVECIDQLMHTLHAHPTANPSLYKSLASIRTRTRSSLSTHPLHSLLEHVIDEEREVLRRPLVQVHKVLKFLVAEEICNEQVYTGKDTLIVWLLCEACYSCILHVPVCL